MAIKQMPGVVPIELTHEHLKEPDLHTLNETLRQLSVMANIMAGAHGPIPLTKDLDLQGNELVNVSVISTDGSQVATSATAGSGTLPAHPVAFLIITVGGQQRKIPLYLP